jgi:hypothetical protein
MHFFISFKKNIILEKSYLYFILLAFNVLSQKKIYLFDVVF